jgi:ABC-type branched-subunit amino acid transport system ATPase component
LTRLKSDRKLTLFRSDTPPTDLEEGRDAFGHRAYGEALASALREAQAPFTYGLFGPFGLGKTTVIDEVRRQVKATGSATAFSTSNDTPHQPLAHIAM